MNLRPPPPPTDPVFGSLCPLKKSLPTQLPTYGDIGRAIGYELHKMDVGFEPGKGDHVYDHGAAYRKVVNDLLEVYSMASVIPIREWKVKNLVENVWKNLRRAKMKGGKSGSEKKGKGRKKRKIEEVLDDLFDIIDDKKTAEVEIDFILDQRTVRKMWIGLVTEEVVKEPDVEDVGKEPEHDTSEDDVPSETDDDGVEYEIEYKKMIEKKRIAEERKRKKLERLNLLKAAETAERGNLSPNIASMMMNDMGVAHGIITENNQEKVMYRMKFSRLVRKARRNKIHEKRGRCPVGFMFDERKDMVLEKVLDGNKNDFEEVKRENCTVVIFPGRKKREEIMNRENNEKEDQGHGEKDREATELFDEILEDTGRLSEDPIEGTTEHLQPLDNDEVFEDVINSTKSSEDSGEYLGHCRPQSGTGRAVASAVLEHFAKYDTDLSKMQIVLTDGTSKMTGCSTGAVAVLERRLGHVLQRSGCMLHHIEKPYEHLHEHYDGVTTGPASYSGPLGKAIEEDVWKLEVGNFIPILNPELLNMIRETPAEVKDNLSRDIRYALGIAEIVITGEHNDWVRRKSGNIHQARWINRQARLLRVYVSTPEPSYQMKRLVNYIIFVFLPTFISIKHYSGFQFGPQHLLQEVKAVEKHCTTEEKKVLHPIINWNGFFAHPENIQVSRIIPIADS
jgi:hypothetical protein